MMTHHRDPDRSSAHFRLKLRAAVMIGMMLGSIYACAGPDSKPSDNGPTANTDTIRGNAADASSALANRRDPSPANRPPDNRPPDNRPPANTGTPATNAGPAPIPVPDLVAMPGRMGLRQGVEMAESFNFREERRRVREIGVTALDEILLLTWAGQIFDHTNNAQYFRDPLPGVKHIVLDPAGGQVWCVYDDQIAVVNPRSGGLSRYLQMPKAGYRLRIDANGRMYLFGPDVNGNGHALILLNSDGSFLKLLSIDHEIRDIAPSITSNQIFVATATDIFAVMPPRAPEHIVSLGAQFRETGISALLADEPGGLYVATPDAVLWMSHTGTLSTVMTGLGGQLAFTTEGVAVFDAARQVLVKLVGLDEALMKDRVRARAARELRDGLMEFARQNYFRAAVHLNRGIRFYPSATRVLYPLAVCRMQTGDYEGAAAAFADFKSAHPDLAATLPDIGVEAARAISAETGDANPSVHFNLGYAELRDANWRAAMREFERTLFFDPQNTAAYYNLALAQVNIGLVFDAAQNLEEFLRLAGDADSAEIRNAKRLLELLSDPEAIEKMLERELRAFEKSADAARSAGEDFSAAVSAYEVFLQEYPSGVYAPYARDRINFIQALRAQKTELDRIEQELARLREQADGSTYDVNYFNAVAVQYAQFAHRFPNTIYLDYILDKLSKVKHEARQALLQVAGQFYRERRFNSAALIYRRLLEWHPEGHALHFNLAQVYRQLEDWDNALKHIQAYHPHARMQERPDLDRLVGAIRQRQQAERIVATRFEPAYRANNLDAAQAALLDATNADTQYALPYYFLALVQRQMASPEYRRSHPNATIDERELLITALANLTIALKLKPEVKWLRTRAQLFENMRDFEKAAQDYTTLIEHADNWEDRRARAEVFRRLVRDDDAIADLRRVIELKPELRSAIEHEIRLIEQERR